MRDKFTKQLNTTLGQLSKAYETRSFVREDLKRVKTGARRGVYKVRFSGAATPRPGPGGLRVSSTALQNDAAKK